MSNSPGGATWYKVLSATTNLQGIVGTTNVVVVSNACRAVEYESMGWGYTTGTGAWQAVLGIYSNHSVDYSNAFDNAGYVAGTHPAESTWGAAVWLLQNTLVFTTSVSEVFESGGVTSQIGSVLVGSIGDYCPLMTVTDVGPTLVTNYLGDGVVTDMVLTADLTTYYKLAFSRPLNANAEDSDLDSVPDFADGFDWDGMGGNADDQSPNDSFGRWDILLGPYADPAQAQLRFTYDASDPADVTHVGSTWTPGAGQLRLWTVNGWVRRKSQTPADSPPGHFVDSGVYDASALGFATNRRLVTLFVEGVGPTNDQPVTLEVDPDGPGGPKDFVCVEGFDSTVYGLSFLNANTVVVDHISVARWEDAFEGGSPPTVKSNLVDIDPDRFRIRVEDVEARGQGTGVVWISTCLSPDGDHDDDASAVEVVECPTNSGIFLSQPMILVADAIDDAFPTNAVGETDNYTNDSTHVTALGGMVWAEYRSEGGSLLRGSARVPTNEIKTVEVNTVVLMTNGVPVMTQAEVEEQMKVADEIYAQVGVQFLWHPIVFTNAPAGVDLSDGVFVFSITDSVPFAVQPETMTLIEERGTPWPEDIHVFFVNRISNECYSSDIGCALASFAVEPSDSNYTYNVVLSSWGLHNSGLTNALAHELGHLLTNAGHEDPVSGTPYPAVNLMVDGSSNTWTGVVWDSRRLLGDQESTIRNNSQCY